MGGKSNDVAPDYLDGSLPGDSGCDPLALAALALPVGVKYVSRPNGGVLDRILPFAPTVEARKLDMANRSPEEELAKAFELFDEDSSGKISVSNMRRIAKELGENLTEDELQAMIDEFDTDGDGEISMAEFTSIMKSTTLYE